MVKNIVLHIFFYLNEKNKQECLKVTLILNIRNFSIFNCSFFYINA